MKKVLCFLGRAISAAMKGVATSSTVYIFSAFVYYLLTQRGVYLNGMDITCVLLIGIGFGLPIVIYDCAGLPQWAKSLIHLGIGYTVLVLTILYMMSKPSPECGTTVVKPGPVPAIVLSLGIAFAIWAGYALYYRREARQINRKIKQMEP